MEKLSQDSNSSTRFGSSAVINFDTVPAPQKQPADHSTMHHPGYKYPKTAGDDGDGKIIRNDAVAHSEWKGDDTNFFSSDGNMAEAEPASEYGPAVKKSRFLDAGKMAGDDTNEIATCDDATIGGGIVATELAASHHNRLQHHGEQPCSSMQRSESAPAFLDTNLHQSNSQRIIARFVAQTETAASAAPSGCTLPSHKSAEHLYQYMKHHREQVQNYCNSSRPHHPQHQQHHSPPHGQQQAQQDHQYYQPDKYIHVPQYPTYCQGSQNAQPGPHQRFASHGETFGGSQGETFGGRAFPTSYLPSHQNHVNGLYPNGNAPNTMSRFAENNGLPLFFRGSHSGEVMPPMGAGLRDTAPGITHTGGMVRRDGTRFGEMPLFLPVSMASPKDVANVSRVQVLLRQQIEAFQATEDDISTHTRGRNKPISMRQVGIRCCHCAHLPVLGRLKGATYFPSSTLGLYQAAQNMSTTHIQCGSCPNMPDHIKAQFQQLLAVKGGGSGAGRPYWAESAKQMGLVDTEEGIYFIRELPPGAEIVHLTVQSTKRKSPVKKNADT